MDNDLKRKVMQRIRFIYFVRKVTSPLIVESALMVAAVVVSRTWVSFGNVFANARTVLGVWSIGADARYIMSAVANADLVVQIIMSVVLVSLVWTSVGAMMKRDNILKLVAPMLRSVGHN